MKRICLLNRCSIATALLRAKNNNCTIPSDALPCSHHNSDNNNQKTTLRSRKTKKSKDNHDDFPLCRCSICDQTVSDLIQPLIDHIRELLQFEQGAGLVSRQQHAALEALIKDMSSNE
jgi:hypothetical protein